MKFLWIFVTVLAAAAAEEYEKPQYVIYSYPQWYVGEYPEIPTRQRRDVSIDTKTGELTADHQIGANGKVVGKLGSTEDALYGKAGYQQTLIDDDRGKLDARAYGTRVLTPYGDSSGFGGGLSWRDKHSQADVDISRQIRGRTSFHAEGGGRWPTSKNSELSLQGTYDHTSGSRPDYGFLGSWRYRFL